MREGESATIIARPDFAYGTRNVPPIAPNSTLVFEVTLLPA